MKRMRDWLLTGLAAVMCAVLLTGCSPAEKQQTELTEEQPDRIHYPLGQERGRSLSAGM